ncbi:hypothetical protein K1T71_003405 [Dendrolimus kikuchii]|uniref:Uncharacterized protein n=1 Tax=Dendrolimus kikuchii TaxID=765133 RepID=A0ACC1DBT7_9NEOP|nr:hypothetical protein K1T71_003405 [Dendrolimus kikuchii]
MSNENARRMLRTSGKLESSDGVVVRAQVQESRVVQTDQGPVRGYKESERNLFTFYNIPYATAPTGRDRYKAPLPPPTWTETFDAVNRNITCVQGLPVPYQQEDCLIADVFVPDTNQTNLPVMVSVHGGAYQGGYGAVMAFRDFSVMKNVITVTFNYRLSVHGFLCLGTENIPGNAGMKDQVALLRWVNRNIASFGGNPNEVTIMGCSAGGSSVDLLTISKSTRGLFQKAIVESSVHLSAYSVQIDPIENAKIHARKLNFTDVDDIDALEFFYLNTSWDILLYGTFFMNNENTLVAFSPCVEKDVGQEIFLHDAPFNIVSGGEYTRYPMIYGFTDLESSLFLNSFYGWQTRMNNNFSEFLPGDLEFDSVDIREEVGRLAKAMYFNNLSVNNDTILGFVDYYTDILFAYSVMRSVELQNQVGNTSIYLHFYSFYDESITPVPHTDYRGAEHCAQMYMVTDSNQTTMTEEWLNMKNRMSDFYYNFITTGQPVVNGSPVASWPAIGENRTPYLSVGRTVELGNTLLESRYRFWEDIYQRHYHVPKPPTHRVLLILRPYITCRSDTDRMSGRTLIYLFVIFVGVSANDSKIVKIAQGAVEGYRESDDIFAFYGIPYASAPTGPNRFKAPNPGPVWLHTLKAVDKRVICPQSFLPVMPSDVIMQEDCLIANVFIPDTSKTNLPVLVYIHGGAFQMGFGNLLTTKNLMKTRKMVIVTFNYRLGAHGFLCLGTKDVPGNAGLKDQLALLRWVQKNIAAFGGNPDDVTVAGYSAGSAIVDLLVVSKAAKGLFKKAIPESGANLAAFSTQVDPILTAKSFAKQLKFDKADDIYALEEFYKTVSYDLLHSDHFFDRVDSTFLFSPCVERDLGEERFLHDAPYNILKKGEQNKVPMLCGFAEMEGLLRIEFFDEWKVKMNENFSDFLPNDLTFESKKEKEKVANEVKHFYFGNNLITEENILEYVNFFSDVLFTYSTLRSIQMQLETGNDQIYLYEYSFVDDETPFVPHTQVRGATHCAQSTAIADGFNFTNNNENAISKSYKKVKATLREMWTNFVYTGKPVPEGSSLLKWPPVNKPWSPHMSLGEKVELRGSLLEERTRFWNKIYKKYYYIPQAPPAPPQRHTEL